MPGEYLLFAKFRGVCRMCGDQITPDEVIWYSPSLRQARHKRCRKYEYEGQAMIWNTWNERLNDDRVDTTDL